MTALIEAKAHQHTITALVQNEAGTINRLVSLFRRRGFSLACFNAGDCEEPGFSRLTLVVNGDDAKLQQCLMQLDKLIDVVECEDLKPSNTVARELALILVDAQGRDEELRVVIVRHGASVAKHNADVVAVEYCAASNEIEALIESLREFRIVEIVRTGVVAMKVSD